MRPASLEWVTCEACSDIPPCTLCGKDLLADLEVEDPRSTVASNLNSNFPHTVFGLLVGLCPSPSTLLGSCVYVCVCVGGSLCCIWAFEALTVPNPPPPCKFQLCSLSAKESAIAWRVWIKPRWSEPSCWAHGAADCIAFWSRTWSLGSRYPKLWPQKWSFRHKAKAIQADEI